MIKKVFNLITKFDGKIYLKFFLLNVFFLINAILQLAYVYSVFPLISSFSNKTNKVNEYLINFKTYINLSNLSDIEFFVIFFLILSIIANISTMTINYLNFNFTYNLIVSIRSSFFKRIQKSYYLELISKNSSFYSTLLIENIERVAANVFGSLNNIIHQTFLIIFISVPLIITNSKIFLILIIFLSLIFFFIMKFLKKYYEESGKKTSKYLQLRKNYILQLIRNFREIKIFDLQKVYYKNFKLNEILVNNLYKKTNVISHSTKPLIEISILIIFFVIFFFNKEQFIFDTKLLSYFGVTIFAFYKIAPAFNTIYSSINNIHFDKDAVNILNDFYRSSDQIRLNNEKIDNLNNLELKNVSFKYDNSKEIVIMDMNFNFKLDSINIITGKSGSGKSTLMNLLMGLIPAKSGFFKINNSPLQIYNNINWFKLISYVPQNVNLINDTILKNITLGQENTDKNKVIDVLKKVDLYDDLKDRLDELIFEYNNNLSGGQLQRMSIARALYRDSKLVIFDEPISNLDTISAKQVIKVINNLKKDRIVIIVSHSLIDEFNYDSRIEL
tara:strand:- start:2932 stop:4605 length:1674 start_codon:yes stop_codon:yes gene_type:complete